MRLARLLVADDEADVGRFVQLVLRQYHVEADLIGVASDGAEAIRLGDLFRPDLVLMDIRMPVVDGLRATAEIRRLSPASCIIVLSAYDDFSYAREALRLGVADYLLKPIRPKELAECLRKHSKQESETSWSNRTQGTASLSSNEVVSRAQEIILTSFSKELMLTTVAEEIHVSPFHLSHIFRRETGCTFKEYCRRVRMREAARLLSETKIPIAEVARRAGYGDAAYFSQAFRRFAGQSPLEFRRRGLEVKAK